MLKLKKTLLLVATLVGAGLLATSTAVNAAVPGFYLGGQAGWADTHQSTTGTTSSKTTGLAGRIFTGYQFDQNWAVELGYTDFFNAKLNYNYDPSLLTGSLKVKQYAIDLMAKGILPLQNGFSVYGKAGAAYVHSKTTGSLTLFGETASGSDTMRKIYPAFAVGASYDITPNVPVDLSYNRIQKTGNGNIPSIDFVALGIAYNFG